MTRAQWPAILALLLAALLLWLLIREWRHALRLDRIARWRLFHWSARRMLRAPNKRPNRPLHRAAQRHFR